MIFKIANRKIGPNQSPIIIAEIGINHNGNLDQAIEIADSAIKSGAEILKHQTHIPDEEMSVEAQKTISVNSKQSIYKIIKNCALSEDDERKLMNYIKSKKKFLLALLFQYQLLIDLLDLVFPHSKLDLVNGIIWN